MLRALGQLALTFVFACGGRAELKGGVGATSGGGDATPGAVPSGAGGATVAGGGQPAVPETERCKLIEQVLSSKTASPPPETPALAWNGAGYGVAWMDYGHGLSAMDFSKSGSYFAAVDEFANVVASERRVAKEQFAGGPGLAWTGSEYALLTVADKAHLARFDQSGASLGEPVLLSVKASGQMPYPELAFAGDGFGIAWTNTEGLSSSTLFARLGPSGSLLAEALVSTGVTGSLDPHLVWTGSSFGVAWSDNRSGSYQIYFAEFDAAGNLRTPVTRITDTEAEPSRPSLVWVGDQYGLAWSEYLSEGNRRAHFRRIAGTGETLGAELQLSGILLGLVWTGTDFGVVLQSRLESPNSLFLSRVDAAGEFKKQQLVSEDWAGYVWTRVAWNGGRLALASANLDVVFRVAECP